MAANFVFSPTFGRMKKLGLVGCGSAAHHHAANLQKIGSLAAVCDIDQAKAEAFSAAYGGKVYTAFDEMLEKETDVELVVICTPTGVHAEQIIKSLQAGKDIVVEGPLCLTSAAAWQIIETEKFCRRRLFLAQSYRYKKERQGLLQQFRENGLGKITSFHLNCMASASIYAATRPRQLFPDGGLLYDLFSEQIDLLLEIAGDLSEANGFVTHKAQDSELENNGVAAVSMTGGAIGTINWLVAREEHIRKPSLEITGEKGMLAFEFESANPAENHGRLYNELAEVLSGKQQSFPGTFDGLKTVEAIEKIYKAVR